MFGCDACKALGKGNIGRIIVRLEARHAAANVLGRDRVHIEPGIGKHPARHRRKRYERGARLAAGFEHGDLGIARHRRIFGLHRRNRVDRAGLAQRFGRHFGQPDRADLARFYKIGQRADRILDRHGEIAAVQVIKIDVIGLQQLQRGFERGADRLGAAVDPALVAIDDDPGFRRQHEFAAPRFQRTADQRFVVPQPIDSRGIEVVIPQIERAVQQSLAIGIGWRRTVGPAQRHAAKAYGIDFTSTKHAAADGHRCGSLVARRRMPATHGPRQANRARWVGI